MKFHFGLGKYFSPFDRAPRAVIRQAVEAGFGVHYCLDYPGASRFFKSNTSRQERSRIEVIARVPCFDAQVTVAEVDATLKALNIDKIEVLQLWGGDEVHALHAQGSELRSAIDRLVSAGKIASCVPQLYHDQTSAAHRQGQPIRSFAFYGSPIGLHVDEQMVWAGRLRDSVCMSCFGGVDRGNPPEIRSPADETIWRELTAGLSWNAFCLAYLESLGFVSRAVGTTGNPARMGEIVRHFHSPVFFSSRQAEAIQRVAFDSCRRDHKGPTGTKERWEQGHRVFRSPWTEIKAMAYSVVKSRPVLKRAIAAAMGRG